MRKIVFFLIIFIVVVGKVHAASYQDTLRPKADGSSIEWTVMPIDSSRWAVIDDTISDGDASYIVRAADSKKYSWIPIGTCPDDWIWFPNIDSVVHYINARKSGNSNQDIDFGQGYPETDPAPKHFEFCGLMDTADITTSYVLYSISYDTNQCGGEWTAYNLYNNVEWGVNLRLIGSQFITESRVTQEYLVVYWQFPDSVEVLMPSASLCSTWTTYECDEVAECITSQVCEFIYTIDGAGITQGWRLDSYSNPAGTKIDSVELRVTVGGVSGDSIAVSYVTESGGECSRYGVDTIPAIFGYLTEESRETEYSVVWSTCPATGLAWTATDLNDSNKGFAVTSMSNLAVLHWTVTLVYYSQVEMVSAVGSIIQDQENKGIIEGGIAR
jgi:hypothetical protein